MNKEFKLLPSQFQPLVKGYGYCLASDRITVAGEPVGYMYREAPNKPTDSGWRFFAGDESEEFTNDPKNFEIYGINTIANYDPGIITFLDKPFGTAWARNSNAEFEAVAFPLDPDK